MVVLSAAIALVGVVEAIGRVETGQTFSGLAWRFDLDGDTSVPTWFAAATLAFAAVLLVVIGVRVRATDRGAARRWSGLAAIVLFLSIDEVATFHEWTGEALDVDTSGFLAYSWVLVGMVAVVAVVAVYLPFVLRLEPRVRALLLASGAVYVIGAVGMEMVDASAADSVGEDTLRYVLGTAVEEGLEMAGVILLLLALVTLLRERWDVTSLSLLAD